MLELKLTEESKRKLEILTFNLSMLELKQRIPHDLTLECFSFNLSMLELKLSHAVTLVTNWMILLISPCWN